MRISKKIARKFIFPTIQSFGMEKVLNNASNNAVINVMYHGVVSDSNNFFNRNISVKQFEKHIQYFRRNFDIISLDQALDIKTKESSSKQKITLSFDDGYVNNLKIVLPILQKYNIPATIYCMGMIADTEAPVYTSVWANYIDVYLKYQKIEELALILKIEKTTDVLFLYEEIKKKSRDQLLNMMLNFENTELTKDLFSRTNINNYALLNKDELCELAESPLITIGSHCYSHCNLANQSLENQNLELKSSKLFLENIIQKEINSVAYPDGSYTRDTIELAEKIGYSNQWAVNYQNTMDKQDSRILNRYGISTTTTFESNMIFLNKNFKKYQF